MSESLARHKADADLLKVGNIITGNAERDAIHVAVAPAEAAQRLYVGRYVRLGSDGKALAAKNKDEAVGIVDPFLGGKEGWGAVEPGERFWIFLFPGTITGMRHAWEHPAFVQQNPATSDKSAAETRLRQAIVDRACVVDDPAEADWVIESIKTNLANPAQCCMPFDGDTFQGDQQFWDDFELVTGMKVGGDDRNKYFRCAC